MAEEETLNEVFENQEVKQEFVADAAAGAEEQRQSFSERFAFLFAKTGPGSIDSYIDSPMNFDRSQGMAQIIRGLTGFLGALDYAVVDVVVGFFRWKGAKAGVDPSNAA